LSLIAVPSALAGWTVDNDHSRLSFVSVKAGSVAEVHHFGQLAGALEDDGSFRVEIDLASVETLIQIRNERMREMLFETGTFPTASLSSQIDLDAVRALEVGEQTEVVSEAELDLHGQKTNLTIRAVVARLASDRLLVTSAQPLTLNADMLGLSEGVEKLREVAGLSSISPAVPVTFRLTLVETGQG
ncbi:MAG: YceI family protein, partial [Wenzhouxiangella sp.]|nr:YceI family protein [Wenzhouxiangella sp.]